MTAAPIPSIDANDLRAEPRIEGGHRAQRRRGEVGQAHGAAQRFGVVPGPTEGHHVPVDAALQRQRQQALLSASRAAVVRPDSEEATAIIERAKTALLEDGRMKSSDAALQPPAASGPESAAIQPLHPSMPSLYQACPSADCGPPITRASVLALKTARVALVRPGRARMLTPSSTR